MLRMVLLAAPAALLAMTSPASAAVFVCSKGSIDLTKDQCTADGNDKIDSVEAAISAATGVDLTSLNLVLRGKSDDSSSPFTFAINSNKTANWSVTSGAGLINFVTVKAGNSFKVYQMPRSGATSGFLDTDGLVNKEGIPQDISHFSLWSNSVPAVPEPTSWAMMIIGLGAIGSLLRRASGQVIMIRRA